MDHAASSAIGAPLKSTGNLERIIANLQHEVGDVYRLREENVRLRRQLDDIAAGSELARQTHRAALNLMNDAVSARNAQMSETAERRLVEEQLRVADRRKDEFLATLAHELRNPLAPIRASLRILKLTGAGDDQTRGVHEMLDRQVTHLVRLVDDLMEISRITRGHIALRAELVDLASIVRDAVEVSKPLIEAGGQELTIELPAERVMLEVDSVRIAQVITNLLNNAAKYTDRGGRIAITARRDESAVEISVRDTGLGIPAEMLPRVFDLFTQVDRTVGRAQGGLGIGLTLVRALVEAHGGMVEARSEGPGRGSEFVFWLPVDEPGG
jgi:signal transduction histidine kinase